MPEDIPKWKPPKAVQKSHKQTMQTIGEKLIKLRGDLTASKLAEYADISRNSYRQMEKGMIYFNMENFLKVLDYHGVDIYDFFASDLDNL